MDGDVPSIPFLCLMSPVGRTSDLSSGQGHKGTSEIPRAGSSNPESHLAGSSGIALGLLSSLSLKTWCPPNLCLLCGGQEGGPAIKVWKKKPGSLGFHLDPAPIELCFPSSSSRFPMVQRELQNRLWVS